VLVIRRVGGLELITQLDHAALAGVLAEHWGNQRFEVPTPRDALLRAAGHHDDGWLELDSIPAFNSDQARPAHFTELPLTTTRGPYGRGVESVYERDLHAGVLVSMHWSGFFTSRWGAGGDWASDDPLALEVVSSQEARWVPALREAWGNSGRRSQFDANTWHAYEVLQAVDLLSLGLGLMDLAPAPDGDPLRVERTLGTIDQQPGQRSISAVPTGAGTATETVVLRPLGEDCLEVDPWPFAGDALDVSVPRRTIEDRRYASAEEAAAAFHGALQSAREIRLRPS
jgi:hypothetical protein